MILFIEDELMFNESYREALEEAGFKISIEHDVQKAITLFKDACDQMELVILDIMMDLPKQLTVQIEHSRTMNGMRTGEEVLRLLNESPKGRAVPKIILTNVANDDFLVKYSSSSEVNGCYRKRDTLPSDLVDIAKHLINKE